VFVQVCYLHETTTEHKKIYDFIKKNDSFERKSCGIMSQIANKKKKIEIRQNQNNFANMISLRQLF